MSPEQARGEPVDQRSDLFSLGSVLFAMITGRPPVNHELGSTTIEQIAQAQLPTLQSIEPTVPVWLDTLVGWLHRARPADRPESAVQIASVLEQCLAHHRQPNKTPLPQCLSLRKHWSRTRQWRVGLACAGLLAASAIGLAALALQQPGKGDAPAASQRQAAPPNINPPTHQVDSLDPELNWSSIDEAMLELTGDADRIEADLQQLWTQQPRSDKDNE